MTNNKTIEKLNQIAGPVSNKWRDKAQEILDAKEWKRDASIIAIRILDRLEFLGWTQREFARRLDVTPQAVTKIVKAKQNLTLGTIRKIEKVLDTDLLKLVGEEEASSAD